MSEEQKALWVTLLPTVVMWIAVIGVLIYNHNLLAADGVPPSLRGQKELPLVLIGAFFLLYNGFMTALRLKQLKQKRTSSNLQ